jgi:type II secretory pathway pseudopilin PulG
MKNKLKNKFGLTHRSMTEGFTMIETLIGVAIFVLVVGVITLFSRNIWVYNSFVSAGLTNNDTGRKILKTMVSEIRTASAADTGAYAISDATASSFTFYSNIDSDSLKEKVRYFFTGTTLQKGVTKPTGSPLTYNPVNEKITNVASNVTSTSIFSYYDKNYDGTSAALPTPVNIASVRLVKIIISIDQDPNRPPPPKTFTTQVSIRNLKDNL